MLLFKFREAVFSSPARRDKTVVFCLIFALIINVLLWAALVFNFQGSEEYIISYYNIYFGISALNNWLVLLLAPFLGLVVLILNFFLSFFFYLKYQILSYFLSISALILNFLVLIFGFLIIYINL